MGSAIKSFGCDCIFYFNYNRINMGLRNRYVVEHMDNLFGKERADELRDQVERMTSEERQAIILNELQQALKSVGGQFILPFEFQSSHGVRTSHYIMFVTKEKRGYYIMKDIMYKLSTDSNEVRNFVYAPARATQLALGLDPEETYSIPALKALLLRKCAGQTMKVEDIFERHNIDTPYIERHFKGALKQLEAECKITVSEPASQRPKNTMADRLFVTFPPWRDRCLMAEHSSIEWTDATWNPVTGCTQVSAGCDHCYALAFAERFRDVPGHPYEQGFDLRLWPERLEMPLRWRKPRRIFVNSMSDLFHADVPEEFIRNVFDTMVKADWHIYQVLTKRPQRLARLAKTLPWPDHIWVGVSVESNEVAWRADFLRRIPAAVRFISAEPLIGPIDQLSLEGIHWVITGGESGAGHRPCDPDWVRDARDRCLAANVAYFHKQWGGRTSKVGGRVLDGRTWDEMPVVDGADRSIHAQLALVS